MSIKALTLHVIYRKSYELKEKSPLHWNEKKVNQYLVKYIINWKFKLKLFLWTKKKIYENQEKNIISDITKYNNSTKCKNGNEF